MGHPRRAQLHKLLLITKYSFVHPLLHSLGNPLYFSLQDSPKTGLSCLKNLLALLVRVYPGRFHLCHHGGYAMYGCLPCDPQKAWLCHTTPTHHTPGVASHLIHQPQPHGHECLPSHTCCLHQTRTCALYSPPCTVDNIWSVATSKHTPDNHNRLTYPRCPPGSNQFPVPRERPTREILNSEQRQP
jgi:hypothetical protein